MLIASALHGTSGIVNGTWCWCQLQYYHWHTQSYNTSRQSSQQEKCNAVIDGTIGIMSQKTCCHVHLKNVFASQVWYRSHMCQYIHVHTSDIYISIYSSHEYNAINNVYREHIYKYTSLSRTCCYCRLAFIHSTIGSKMFCVHALNSEHALWFYVNAYWLEWTEHGQWRKFCAYDHCHY